VLAGYSAVLDALSGLRAPRWLIDQVQGFSFQSHFEQVTRGVIAARDLVFFLSVIAVFLFANAVIIEQRKAS
jgi:ABC-2 type transport system permease protein